MDKITIEQIKEIKSLKNKHKTVKGWKKAMAKKADELGITNQEILKINRDNY